MIPSSIAGVITSFSIKKGLAPQTQPQQQPSSPAAAAPAAEIEEERRRRRGKNNKTKGLRKKQASRQTKQQIRMRILSLTADNASPLDLGLNHLQPFGEHRRPRRALSILSREGALPKAQNGIRATSLKAL
jgi:hypothetical protein